MSAPEEAALLKAYKIQALEMHIEETRRVAADERIPRTLRAFARRGLERLEDLLEAVRGDNEILAEELVLGTIREDGKRRPDGLDAITPYWARGLAVLDSLRDFVEVDESQSPVTVTMHWERVPPNRRREAASLATELVDAYRGRGVGGRPRRSRISPLETG